MKNRNGFVSNSSSSSFILAYRESTGCEHCGARPKNFLDIFTAMCDNNYDDSTSVESVGLDDSMILLKDDYKDEEVINKVENAIKKLSADPSWEYAYVNISYIDKPVKLLIDEWVNMNHLHILWKSES